MADIVSGIFNSARDAEHAIQDLLNSQFSDEQIGVVVHDSQIGPGIADDLGREFRSGVNPPDQELTSPSDVYEDLPILFVQALQNLDTASPNASLDWFNHELDAGKVLVIVNATNHADDALRIMTDDGALLPDVGSCLSMTDDLLGTQSMADYAPGQETPFTTNLPDENANLGGDDSRPNAT